MGSPVDTKPKKIHFALLDKVNLLGYYLHLWLLQSNPNGKYFLVDKKAMNEAYSDPVAFANSPRGAFELRVA